MLRGTVAESATAATFGVDLRRERAGGQRAGRAGQAAGPDRRLRRGLGAGPAGRGARGRGGRRSGPGPPSTPTSSAGRPRWRSAVNALGRAVTEPGDPAHAAPCTSCRRRSWRTRSSWPRRSSAGPWTTRTAAARTPCAGPWRSRPTHGEIVVSLHPDDYRNLVGIGNRRGLQLRGTAGASAARPGAAAGRRGGRDRLHHRGRVDRRGGAREPGRRLLTVTDRLFRSRIDAALAAAAAAVAGAR